MTTPNTENSAQPHPASNPQTSAHRRRLADQIANQLLTARLLGGRVRFIQRHNDYLGKRPPLQAICQAAPAVAATGDPDLVRAAYAPSGALAVIRLHGPQWSLILSGGQPLPDWILAVHDDFPLHLLQPSEAWRGWLHALDLAADPMAAPALTRMCQRIHTAIGHH